MIFGKAKELEREIEFLRGRINDVNNDYYRLRESLDALLDHLNLSEQRVFPKTIVVQRNKQ